MHIIEIWRPVKGYEGLYEVSNFGRVRALHYKGSKNLNIKIMKQKLTRFGYYEVALNKNKTPKTFKVHRLVAEAFIPNPNNYPIINHKDECKTNNKVENLEWCTYKHNTNYGSCLQRISEAQSRPIKQISLNGEIIRTFSSAREADKMGIAMQQHICDVCNHRNGHYTAGGFKWEYV